MKKNTSLYRSLLIVTIIVLASCTTQSSLHGFWKNVEGDDTIEFKAGGEVIIVDNMSATVIGNYKIEDNGLLKIELIASDILRDSVQSGPKTTISAKIMTLNSDKLQLQVVGENGVENYRRIR